MASNYTANPVATQAPSAAPGPNVLPVVSLIADADGNTAANLYQAWKSLCDFIGYLMQIIGGTRTAQSIVVDATGGTAVTGTAGVVQARGLAISNSTTAIAPGVAHLALQGAVPTLVAAGGAGTGPTLSLETGSSDSRGLVSVTTGTAPSTSATIVRVQFANAYVSNLTANCKCFLTPANAAAAALSGVNNVYILLESNTEFQIQIGIGGTLAATTNYQWRYFVLA